MSEDEDARHTAKLVEQDGRQVVLLAGDLTVEENCGDIVEHTVAELGGLDILVNNIAYQNPAESLGDWVVRPGAARPQSGRG